MLYRCVRSLDGIAERLVAWDGAFSSYPRGQAQSPPEQWEAIVTASLDCRLRTYSGTPRIWESQIAKRRALMRLGQHWTDDPGRDWLLVIDGDERVKSVHQGFHAALARVRPDRLVANVKGAHETRMPRLFRAHPRITVEGGHNGYRIEDGPWLATLRYARKGETQAPIANMSGYLTLLHDRHLRAQTRMEAAQVERVVRHGKGEE